MSKKKLTRKKIIQTKKMINYKNCKNENIKDNGKRFFYNLKYKKEQMNRKVKQIMK